eukprot:4070700-Amphidinium_carterae.1
MSPPPQNAKPRHGERARHNNPLCSTCKGSFSKACSAQYRHFAPTACLGQPAVMQCACMYPNQPQPTPAVRRAWRGNMLHEKIESEGV